MNSFFPPRRILMGAGPTEIPARVLSATARPTIGHLDTAFTGMMEELKEPEGNCFNACDKERNAPSASKRSLQS